MIAAQILDPARAAAAGWPRLLGDIGGTNARFAWQVSPDAGIELVTVLATSDHAGLVEAIDAYLQQHQLARPQAIALGMAVPVVSDHVCLTNNHWQFSVSQARAQLDVPTLLVLNDFTALAMALPALSEHEKFVVGPRVSAQAATVGLIGPGTGLGVSGLVPMPNSPQWAPIMGEGGHVSLSAANATEFAVIQYLQNRYGHASAERALSGQGLVDVLHGLAQVHGESRPLVDHPAEVIRLSQLDDQSLASATVDLFCSWLGSVAGDLALTLGARGGVYLGGGILPRIKNQLARSAFRHRFEAKGRFQTYLQNIPTWLIDAPSSPALLGASQALNGLSSQGAHQAASGRA
jgi:glucokinase